MYQAFTQAFIHRQTLQLMANSAEILSKATIPVLSFAKNCDCSSKKRSFRGSVVGSDSALPQLLTKVTLFHGLHDNLFQ